MWNIILDVQFTRHLISCICGCSFFFHITKIGRYVINWLEINAYKIKMLHILMWSAGLGLDVKTPKSHNWPLDTKFYEWRIIFCIKTMLNLPFPAQFTRVNMHYLILSFQESQLLWLAGIYNACPVVENFILNEHFVSPVVNYTILQLLL